VGTEWALDGGPGLARAFDGARDLMDVSEELVAVSSEMDWRQPLLGA
jgi:hypothetical protein